MSLRVWNAVPVTRTECMYMDMEKQEIAICLVGNFIALRVWAYSPLHTGVAIASDDAFSTILTRKRDDQFTLNDFSR